ncbi:MAG: hypothetical protein Fur0020_11190 [Thermodesulfovibrionia bacterium]
MIVEPIKDGFRFTHKNWQLILIHVVVAFINIITFFLFVGVPLFIVITYLGFDITHLDDIIPSFIDNPLKFITRYMGLVFFIITALILYLTIVSILYIYILGGTLGILKDSIMNVTTVFHLNSFFKEAKRYFLNLFWLAFFLILAIMSLLVIIVIFGGITIMVLQGLDIRYPSIQMFFNYFITLFIVVFSLIILYIAIVFSLFSFVISVTEDKRVMESIRHTYAFLRDNPLAFLYYFILIIGISLINLVALLLGVIPVIAPLLNILIQNYLSVVLWCALISFYIRCKASLSK